MIHPRYKYYEIATLRHQTMPSGRKLELNDFTSSNKRFDLMKIKDIYLIL